MRRRVRTTAGGEGRGGPGADLGGSRRGSSGEGSGSSWSTTHWDRGTNAELRAGGGLWVGMGQNGRRGEMVTRWGVKRRESSSNGYGGLTRDVITFDCFKRAGSVHRDSLDSQPTDRLEEAYRRLLAVRSTLELEHVESVDLRSEIRKAHAVLAAFACAGQRGDTVKRVATRGRCVVCCFYSGCNTSLTNIRVKPRARFGAFR